MHRGSRRTKPRALEHVSDAGVDDAPFKRCVDRQCADHPRCQVPGEDRLIPCLTSVKDVFKIDEEPEVAEPLLGNESGDPVRRRDCAERIARHALTSCPILFQTHLELLLMILPNDDRSERMSRIQFYFGYVVVILLRRIDVRVPEGSLEIIVCDPKRKLRPD